MNKGELKARVLDTLVRQDLSGNPIVDMWVQAATARLNQDLLLNAQVFRATQTVTDRLIDLPADFISAKSVRVTSGAFGAEAGNLEYQPPEAIVTMAQQAARGYALPRYFTTIGQRMELAPWRAGSTFNVEIWYYRAFPEMLTDADTNFILTQYPTLYLNLVAAEGHKYLLESDAAVTREAYAMAEIQRLMMRKEAEKYGDGPLIQRPTRRIGGRFS